MSGFFRKANLDLDQREPYFRVDGQVEDASGASPAVEWNLYWPIQVIDSHYLGNIFN